MKSTVKRTVNGADSCGGTISDGMAADMRGRMLSDIQEIELEEIAGRGVVLLEGLGDYIEAFDKLNSLSGRCILIFRGENRYIDARIASSLGVNTGIEILPETPIDNNLRELAVYHFYTQLPHGGIEPFLSLTESYQPNIRISPAIISGKFPTHSEWEKHLVKPGRCASCEAFRICSGYFAPQSDNEDCSIFMTEVLEGIEFLHGGGR